MSPQRNVQTQEPSDSISKPETRVLWVLLHWSHEQYTLAGVHCTLMIRVTVRGACRLPTRCTTTGTYLVARRVVLVPQAVVIMVLPNVVRCGPRGLRAWGIHNGSWLPPPPPEPPPHQHPNAAQQEQREGQARHGHGDDPASHTARPLRRRPRRW